MPNIYAFLSTVSYKQLESHYIIFRLVQSAKITFEFNTVYQLFTVAAYLHVQEYMLGLVVSCFISEPRKVYHQLVLIFKKVFQLFATRFEETARSLLTEAIYNFEGTK